MTGEIMVKLKFGILLTGFWACSNLKQQVACDYLFKLINPDYDVASGVATKMKNCLASIPRDITSKIYYMEEDQDFVEKVRARINPLITKPLSFIAFFLDCLEKDRSLDDTTPVGNNTRKYYLSHKSFDLAQIVSDALFFTISQNENQDSEAHKYIKSLSKAEVASFEAEGLSLADTNNPPNAMILTSFNDNFSSIFEEVCVGKLDIPNPNNIHAFKLKNNLYESDYTQLIELLQKNICNYVYSRAEIDQLKKNINFAEVQSKTLQAASRLNINSKTLGDLLNYLFIENEEKAPKLMSKIEFNNYENDCDGIYLKKINNRYQIVLGTSKIYPSIDDGMSHAVKRICTLVYQPFMPSVLVSDFNFISRFSREDIKTMKSIFIPMRPNEELEVKAFGIFIGYSMNLSCDLNSLPTEKARAVINLQINKDLEHVIEQLNTAIDEEKIKQYSYYVYLLPFNDVKNTSRIIMEKVLGKNENN